MLNKLKNFILFLLAIIISFGSSVAMPLMAYAQNDNNAQYNAQYNDQDYSHYNDQDYDQYYEQYYGDTLLDEYIEEHYSGKTTVTIAVSRPIANSRAAIDVTNLYTGHTFIRLDFGSGGGIGNGGSGGGGDVIVRGFTAVYNWTLWDVINNVTVEGVIRDESTRDWNAAIVYEITPEQANAIKKFIDEFNVNEFNMIFNNCITFAVNALEAAGISPPTQEHNWTLPPRDEIIAAMPFYVIDKATAANLLLSRIYYGYTPADAVQDFKSDANCILKYDGAIHEITQENRPPVFSSDN